MVTLNLLLCSAGKLREVIETETSNSGIRSRGGRGTV